MQRDQTGRTAGDHLDYARRALESGLTAMAIRHMRIASGMLEGRG